MGKIMLEMYWLHAPKTCKNFVELARRGYYNGVIFHRIVSNFVVQGGDPSGTGMWRVCFVFPSYMYGDCRSEPPRLQLAHKCHIKKLELAIP